MIDPKVVEALKRAAVRFAEGRKAALSSLGNFEDVRKKTADIKDKAISMADDIWKEVRFSLEQKGAVFYEAVDARSACERIYSILSENDVPLIIKGKSITSEEIELNRFLLSKGIQPVETDLGERIIQLKGEPPSHLIVPAIHNTKEEVARVFSDYFGKDVPDDPYIITKLVREDLRRYFLKAKAGFTGANVVSGSPSSIFIMTNEGNGRLSATMPPVYITLIGWEKVVETLEDAMWILEVLPKNSVGLEFSSYVTIFNGLFNWSGNRKWYVIVLDNGRKKASGDRYLREALKCIRCGACMNVCPVYRVLGGQKFAHIYMGGIGVAWTAITAGVEQAYEVARMCTGCGSCEEVCPVGIPISDLVSEVRSRVEKKDVLEDIAVKFVTDRKKAESLGEISRVSGVYTGEPVYPWARSKGFVDGKTLVYSGCVLREFYPDLVRDAIELLDELGLDPFVVREECCGLPAKVYGRKDKFFWCALENTKLINTADEVIVLCDSCFSTFNKYPVEFKNAKLFIEKLLELNVVFEARKPLNVFIHIPCHLKLWGKEEKLFEFFGNNVKNINLLRHEVERECCGGAGLYRFKMKEVAEAIFSPRKQIIKDMGVDIVLTSCPSCMDQFKAQFKKSSINVEVMHPAQFLYAYTRRCLTH